MKRLWAIPVLAAILAVLCVTTSRSVQQFCGDGAAVCAAAGIALLQDGCVPVLTIGIPLLLGVIRWQKERKQ